MKYPPQGSPQREQTLYSQVSDYSNTDAYAINAQSENHSYHTNGLDASVISGFNFDAGGNGTSHPIAAIADATGGDILVTTTGAHGLAVGDIISQNNLLDSAYVGIFVVKTVPLSTTYTVTAVFTLTDTGTVNQAFTLEATESGLYEVEWTASATSATSNETFDFSLFKNASQITSSLSRRKFGTAGDFGDFGAQCLISLAAGDKISFALINNDSAGDITIRNFNLIATKL